LFYVRTRLRTSCFENCLSNEILGEYFMVFVFLNEKEKDPKVSKAFPKIYCEI